MREVTGTPGSNSQVTSTTESNTEVTSSLDPDRVITPLEEIQDPSSTAPPSTGEDRAITALEQILDPSTIAPPSTVEEAELLLTVAERCFELGLGTLNTPEGRALRCLMTAVLVKIKTKQRKVDKKDPPPL